MTSRAELAALEAAIATAPSAIVAFSGGVDSSLVAAVSARVLGDRALAVTAVSPALATGELDGARSVAAAVGIAHRAITTDELAREGYRRNGEDRCYHCKSELYDRLAALGATEGYAAVFSGANVDDLGDWRPGLRAAAEHDVRHPLVEAGFRKADVRRWASDAGDPERRQAGDAVPRLAASLRHAGRSRGPGPGGPGRAGVASARLSRPARAASRPDRARGARPTPISRAPARPGRATRSCPRCAAPATTRRVIDERPLRSGSFTGRLLPLAISG